MTPCPAGRAALSVIGTTAALGAATLAYSLIEARCPVLRRIDVPVLAADEEPLTVLHLADLHLTGRTEARVAWVRQLAQLQPDVVVNTGDNLSLASGLEPLRRALEPLTGLPGAFVMGDHDYRSTVFRLPTRYLHRDPRKASSLVRDEDIEALKDGYDTLVGERGQSLSGGQRQRLALARALLARPGVLILDEFTSHLDPDLDERVRIGVRTYLPQATIIEITHRLQWSEQADHVVVMDAGVIVQAGPPAKLLAEPGPLRTLTGRGR